MPINHDNSIAQKNDMYINRHKKTKTLPSACCPSYERAIDFTITEKATKKQPNHG